MDLNNSRKKEEKTGATGQNRGREKVKLNVNRTKGGLLWYI